MKKLIFLFIVLATTISYSQNYWASEIEINFNVQSNTTVASFVDQNGVHIVYSRNGGIRYALVNSSGGIIKYDKVIESEGAGTNFSNVIKVAGPGEFQKKSDNTISESGDIYEWKLEQNYPNPFNPITVISFSVGDNSFITLRVFDILGKEVTTLLDERMEAGNHQIKFDGSYLVGGIYFYEIKANKFQDVKKLILIK